MLNIAVIMGRLTANPELRTTANGTSVTSFTVAVDRKFQKQGAEKQTDFINVVAWQHTADFITRYFRKGSMIAVNGYIQTRNYEDKNGNKRTAVEIVANNVSFCGSKAETNTTDRATPTTENQAIPQQDMIDEGFSIIPTSDDMLPFDIAQDDNFPV